MQTITFPSFLSLSKITIRLLLNSFILGPLAIVYALVAEAMLSSETSILFGKPQIALLGLIFGGFFCSFACMIASMLILLPIALWELNKYTGPKSVKAIVSSYLPVPVLLAIVPGLLIWSVDGFKPLPHEPIAILISFYLTASTGLVLLAKFLSTYTTKV